jgi:hypothetical protein
MIGLTGWVFSILLFGVGEDACGAGGMIRGAFGIARHLSSFKGKGWDRGKQNDWAGFDRLCYLKTTSGCTAPEGFSSSITVL